GWIPLPRHVVGLQQGESWHPAALLGPGGEVACDLGEAVCLPEVVYNPTGAQLWKLKPGEGMWLRATFLPKLLSGALPTDSELVHEWKLWRSESRVGIALNPSLRSVQKGMLYQARHARPVRDTSLEVWVEGLPESWFDPAPLIPLGGERRMAEVEVCAEKAELFSQESDGKSPQQIAVVLLTPALLDARKGPWEALGSLLPGAKLVCAVADRPVRIGG